MNRVSTSFIDGDSAFFSLKIQGTDWERLAELSHDVCTCSKSDPQKEREKFALLIPGSD